MNKLFPIALALLFFSCDDLLNSDVHGCLDSQACNYNPDANIDNNSCFYAEDWEDECGVCDLVPSNDCTEDDCGVWGGNNEDIDACGICFGQATSADNCLSANIIDNWEYVFIEYYDNSTCSGEPYDIISYPDYRDWDDYYFDNGTYYRRYISFYEDSTFVYQWQYCPTEDSFDPDCILNNNIDDYYYGGVPPQYSLILDGNSITGESLIILSSYVPIEYYLENNEKMLALYFEFENDDYYDYYDDDYDDYNENGWWDDTTNYCAKLSLKESMLWNYNNESSQNTRNNNFQEHPFKILRPNNE